MTLVGKLIISAIAMVFMSVAMCGCGLEMKVDYYGKTGVDDRKVTPDFYRSASVKKGERY